MSWIGDILEFGTDTLPRKYYEWRDKRKLRQLLNMTLDGRTDEVSFAWQRKSAAMKNPRGTC